jgi:hypothetical protein
MATTKDQLNRYFAMIDRQVPTRVHFHMENGHVVADEEGKSFPKQSREAVEAGASIARDAFIRGSATQVVDVR